MNNFILMLTLFFSIHSFANLDCDPKANCMMTGPNIPCPTWRNPFRTCPGPKIENVTCVSVRAACRTKCGQINDDANRFQKEDYSRIATIDGVLQQNAEQQANLDLLCKNSEEVVSRNNETCEAIKSSYNECINNIETQKVFVTELDYLISLKLSNNDLESRISLNSNYSSKDNKYSQRTPQS